MYSNDLASKSTYPMAFADLKVGIFQIMECSFDVLISTTWIEKKIVKFGKILHKLF